MNQPLYYVLQFFLGGASVVGITVIAKYIHPRYTGILYAFPIILVLAMIFVYTHQGFKSAEQTLRSIVIYEFTLVYFVIAFYFLLSRIGFWNALGSSLLTWVLIVLLVQQLLKG